MIRNLSVISLLCASLAFAGPAMAADAAKKPIHLSDQVSVKATVEAIDHTNREVTLKGPKGNLVTLEVDESVERFNALKVGDVVNATYYTSVALEVRKAGSVPEPDSVAVGAAKLEGTKPGGLAGTKSTTTVTIVAIDMDTPAVTVKTSDGRILSFRVNHKERLNGVNVGDLVVVEKTEALMIAVDPAK